MRGLEEARITEEQPEAVTWKKVAVRFTVGGTGTFPGIGVSACLFDLAKVRCDKKIRIHSLNPSLKACFEGGIADQICSFNERPSPPFE